MFCIGCVVCFSCKVWLFTSLEIDIVLKMDLQVDMTKTRHEHRKELESSRTVRKFDNLCNALLHLQYYPLYVQLASITLQASRLQTTEWKEYDQCSMLNRYFLA